MERVAELNMSARMSCMNSIRQEFTNVVRHPVLKKWLYLPEASEDFESVSSGIIEAIRIGDQRFGVEPKERKSRKRKP